MTWRGESGARSSGSGESGAQPGGQGAPAGDGARIADAVAGASSRRGFLARVGAAAMSVAGVSSVGSFVAPGDAEAYHFCGHIYTTDSCPHPTGLPRIDAKGFPIKARDGRPVDDLGRYVDVTGAPVDDAGQPLTDADGAPLARATRTPVCAAAGDVHDFNPHVDGAWYRCCGGRVRKLVDCCGNVHRRVNGDRALTGYCYRGRKVFCVMYYDTNVKC